MSNNTDDLKTRLEAILEASIPIVKIWEGLLIAPIIGSLDTERTQILMEKLLNKIMKEEANVAILDITGVPTVDSRTAQHLVDTISAVRLLGSNAIITGIKPPIAQTLVHLGIVLTDIKTAKSLDQGVKMALDLLGIKLTKKD
jgi:rsbT co-antagonist protein RsbR